MFAQEISHNSKAEFITIFRLKLQKTITIEFMNGELINKIDQYLKCMLVAHLMGENVNGLLQQKHLNKFTKPRKRLLKIKLILLLDITATIGRKKSVKF